LLVRNDAATMRSEHHRTEHGHRSLATLSPMT